MNWKKWAAISSLTLAGLGLIVYGTGWAVQRASAAGLWMAAAGMALCGAANIIDRYL